jgi:hypothetical protein
MTQFKKWMKNHKHELLLIFLLLVLSPILSCWKGLEMAGDIFTVIGVSVAVYAYFKWRADYDEQGKIDQFKEIILLARKLEIRLEKFRKLPFQIDHHPFVIMLKIIRDYTQDPELVNLFESLDKLIVQFSNEKIMDEILTKVLNLTNENYYKKFYIKDGNRFVFRGLTRPYVDEIIEPILQKYFVLYDDQHSKYLFEVDDLFIEIEARLKILRVKFSRIDENMKKIKDHINYLKIAFQSYHLSATKYKDCLFQNDHLFKSLGKLFNNFFIISALQEEDDEMTIKINNIFESLVEDINKYAQLN